MLTAIIRDNLPYAEASPTFGGRSGWVATALLVILCVWLAGWFFYFGSASFYRQFLYILFFVPATGLVIVMRSWLWPFSRDIGFLLAAAFVLHAVITLLYQIEPIEPRDPVDAVRYALMIVLFLAVWYLIRLREAQAPVILLSAITLAGLVSALWFLGSWVTDLGPAAGKGRLDFSNPEMAFGWNTNRLASLFLPPSAGGLALALMGRARVIRAFGWCAAIAGVVIIFWTQSRQGMIGAVVIGATMLFYCRKWTLLSIFTLAVVLVGTAALSGALGARDLTESRTIVVRLALYRDTISDIASRPLLGEGWMTRESPGTYGFTKGHSHNTFLHVWLQGGIVSFVLFCALIVHAFYCGWIVLRNARSGGSSQVAVVWAMAVLLFFVVISMVTVRDPFAKPTTSWLLLWVPLAIIYAERVAGRKRATPSKRGSRGFPGAKACE